MHNDLLRYLFGSMTISINSAREIKLINEWSSQDIVMDYNKLYYIMDGGGEINVEGVTYRPKKGQVCIIPAGFKHSYNKLSNIEGYYKYYCHFNAKLAHQNLFDFIDSPLVFDTKNTERIIIAFTNLVKAYNSHHVTSLLEQKIYMGQLICEIIEQPLVKIKEGTNPNIDKIGTILTYIHNNLDKKITIKELADYVHLSSAYMIRIFKQFTNMPPIKYINHVRLEKAKEFLETTDLRINEISSLCGFESTYYFLQLFKKYYDINPTAYKKTTTSFKSKYM